MLQFVWVLKGILQKHMQIVHELLKTHAHASLSLSFSLSLFLSLSLFCWFVDTNIMGLKILMQVVCCDLHVCLRGIL